MSAVLYLLLLMNILVLRCSKVF